MDAVLQRGEELIEESFTSVATRLQAPLEACMEAGPPIRGGEAPQSYELLRPKK